jgi:hypothetical protein
MERFGVRYHSAIYSIRYNIRHLTTIALRIGLGLGTGWRLKAGLGLQTRFKEGSKFFFARVQKLGGLAYNLVNRFR